MNPINVTLEEIADFANLYDAFRNAQAHKRFRTDVIDFATDPTEKLIEIQNELLWGTYTAGPYFTKEVFEPKYRIIHAQEFRDRIVPWAIYQKIMPYYDRAFINDSYAGRVGKGVHRARARLQYWQREVKRKPGQWYTLKLDVSKFYYRIDHKILLDIIATRITDKRLYDLIDKLINSTDMPFGLPRGTSPIECSPSDWIYGIGMPIGLLLALLFSNIYLDTLDQYVKNDLGIHRWERYADDMIAIVPSKGEAKEELLHIKDFLEYKLHLDLNKKTAIIPADKPVEFCGAIISPAKIKLKKSSRQRIKREIKAIERKYENGTISFARVNNSMQSIFGQLKHCDADNFRRYICERYTFTRKNNGGK